MLNRENNRCKLRVWWGGEYSFVIQFSCLKLGFHLFKKQLKCNRYNINQLSQMKSKQQWCCTNFISLKYHWVYSKWHVKIKIAEERGWSNLKTSAIPLSSLFSCLPFFPITSNLLLFFSCFFIWKIYFLGFVLINEVISSLALLEIISSLVSFIQGIWQLFHNS